MDPHAIPCDGLAMGMFAYDEVMVYITKIADIFETGGITIGSSFAKFLNTSEGASFFDKKVRSILLLPGQVLYIPTGWWTAICSLEPVKKGAQPVTSHAVMCLPIISSEKNACESCSDAVFAALTKIHTAQFAKKAAVEVWERRKEYFKQFNLPHFGE